MQTLVEAASHIAQEIERTQQHLRNLEQALEGLKPLITIDAATATLSFITTAPMQTVEDVSIVNAEVPVNKAMKSRLSAKPRSKKSNAKGKTRTSQAHPIKAADIPATGAVFWLACIGRKKLSATELIDTAMQKLELQGASRVVVANRARAWLNASAKSGLLVAAGTRDGSKLYKRSAAKVGEVS
jgi:hypothetical protein